jgi:tetratricopeptide (TPR) repeat protein
VKPSSPRVPHIVRFYHRYLDSGNAADFVRSVSATYTLATLHRLARDGNRLARRGAVLAITLLGHSESVPQVGRALHDSDRAVRLIAEDGIQAMWSRAGTFEQRQRLQMVMRLNAAGKTTEALALADRILDEHPGFGEAWFQRAEAQWTAGHYFAAIADCQRALECESEHFPAALSMAQCYLELGDLPMAITCLQQTLRIHPHLEIARAQMLRVKRELREQTDR